MRRKASCFLIRITKSIFNSDSQHDNLQESLEGRWWILMAAAESACAPGNGDHLQPGFAGANTSLRKRHIGQTEKAAVTHAMVIPLDGEVSTFGI